MSENLILSVLRLKVKYDLSMEDFLVWEEGGELHIGANCSDIFYWGTADVEEINASNFHIFKQACEDLATVNSEYFAAELFCARIRKMRPQGAWYKAATDKAKVVELFDACEPQRSVDILNPKEQ